MGFVHLHVHSQYSILDGTADPSKLVARAAELGMPALALTDTCNLYGGVAFFKACKGAGIRPVIGAELHVQPEGIDFEDPAEVESGYQIRVLVEDQTGYENICQLITTAIFDGNQYKPRIDLDLLRKHSKGLIVLTGGRKGVLGRYIRNGQHSVALDRALELAEILKPGQLFFELQDLGLDGEEEINHHARTFCADHGYETVVTQPVHYLQPDQASSHEVLNAIALGVSLNDSRRIQSPTDQAYFKTEEEIRALFPDDLPAIERTVAIAERCHFKYDFNTYHFPATTPPELDEEGNHLDTDANWEYFYRAFPPPKDYGLPAPEVAIPPRPEGAGSMNGYTRWYCYRGLELRLQHVDEALHAEYWERMDVELGIIFQMGFPAYFLIVAEFINWSKDHDIPVGPGRGSAAGSLVAYAMKITDIDPIRFDLLFERFLNPERVSMPDIDVDFCQDRREEAIEHVRVKYGAPLVSQIITYGKLKAKAAVRDVSRVMDLSFGQADRIAKLIPEGPGVKLKGAIEESEQLRTLRENDPTVRRVVDTALAVEGLCRQTGVHAAGVVIADKPLVAYAPLYRDKPDGGPVVQYDMKSAESIGLIKFDFLGLKTLDQIRDAVAMVAINRGVQLDMEHIPVDDLPTYELLQAGDGLGVFQLESSGMRELLTNLRPSVLDDLVALVALYRPGPLSSGMVDDFVDRKHGRQEISYPLPMLEGLLKSTYGTIIYQEQVMQIAQVMSGYSLGEADLLRRAMGKKKKEEMDKQKSRFVTGAIDNNIDGAKAEEIFELLAKFAAYGFNKSHSAAYGYVSYQTAYLKANYRPEYMAALMTIEAANTEKVLMYIGDCRDAGIPVLPVCVNQSQRAFWVPKESVESGEPVIRFGMAAVKNVGSNSILAIQEARKDGPFKDAMDFFERVDPRAINKRVVENLIKAGAFDFTGVPRAALVAGIDRAMTAGARYRADKASGQGSLFGGGAAVPRPAVRWPNLAEWPRRQKLTYEKDVLGLYLSGHPMQSYRADVERFASSPLAQLEELNPGDTVRVVGLPGEVKVVKTRRGDKMAFVQLEDVDATIECVFFSDPWATNNKMIRSGEVVLITGRLEIDGKGAKILASTAEAVGDIRLQNVREFRLKLRTGELNKQRNEQLANLLEAHPGGCRVRLELEAEGDYRAVLAVKRFAVAPSTALEESVSALYGRDDVVEIA